MHRVVVTCLLSLSLLGNTPLHRGAPCLAQTLPAAGIPENASVARYFRELQAAYSGERALEVVAFMEPTWRLVPTLHLALQGAATDLADCRHPGSYGAIHPPRPAERG